MCNKRTKKVPGKYQESTGKVSRNYPKLKENLPGKNRESNGKLQEIYWKGTL